MTAAALVPNRSGPNRSGLGKGAERDLAYGAARSAALTPRQAEYRVFARITHRLTEAQAAVVDQKLGAGARLAEAACDNLRLWLTLAADLATDGNGLPDELRAGLISLAGFVERETPRVLRGDADGAALVDINTAVMKGLRGHQEPETCPG